MLADPQPGIAVAVSLKGPPFLCPGLRSQVSVWLGTAGHPENDTRLVVFLLAAAASLGSPRDRPQLQRHCEAHADEIPSSILMRFHVALTVQGQRTNSGLLSRAQKIFAYACWIALGRRAWPGPP